MPEISEKGRRCPKCRSDYIYFSIKNGHYKCENCEESFDRPEEYEIERSNAIDVRKIKVFLASSILLKTERDLISSVAVEYNSSDLRTYIELNRCEYDNAIKMDTNQQNVYNSWIDGTDVFLLLVSKGGIGEFTAKEIERAVNIKHERGIKLFALVCEGVTEKTEALKRYEKEFDLIESFDDPDHHGLGSLHKKAMTLIDGIYRDSSLGKVIENCLRLSYDIIIAGASESSLEFVYSLANKFNLINNENFSSDRKEALVFNLKIVPDEKSEFSCGVNINDYYFVLTDGGEETLRRIKESYSSCCGFLDISVLKENPGSEELMNSISKELNGNYITLFDSKDALVGKETIRYRLDKINKAYESFINGIRYYNEKNFYEAESRLKNAVEFGFIDAAFYLGFIYSSHDIRGFEDYNEAKKNFIKAAEHGNASAQYNLGILLYDKGELDEAEKYYRMAADREFAGAQFNLGVMLYDKGETDEAEKYYRMAADQGNLYAQNNLGSLLKVKGQTDEAEKYFRLSADQECTEAQYNLGNLLEDKGQIDEAEKYFRLAAEQGDSKAQCNLGVILDNKGQTDEAERYYRMAANQGHITAQNNLGILWENKKQTDKAEKYYRMAADQGHSDAQFSLGLLLENKGQKDEAEKYYCLAADQGNADAQNNLGILLEDKGQTGEAEKYYRMAADQGNVSAQNNLDLLLEDKEEDDEYDEYYRLATEQGDADAQYRLGYLWEVDYLEPDEAEKYYRMAADQGHAEAQYNLGLLLRDKEETDEAVKYFRMAAEQGHTEAENDLYELLEEDGDED